MKRLSVLVTLLIAFSLAAPSAHAANWRKGKALFKDNCLSCHDDKSDSVKVSPGDKTKAQWNRFFDRDKHEAKPEVFNKLSKKDLENLKSYLDKYSLDSAKPGTCG